MIGRIYRIESDIDKRFYIGSTTQTLKKRFDNHKSKAKEECRKNTYLYVHFNECGWSHASISLVCEYDNITKEELLQHEKHEIERTRSELCLNKNRPMITPEDKKATDKEYGRIRRQQMKEHERERVRLWRLNNPDKRKEQTQRYRDKKKAQDL